MLADRDEHQPADVAEPFGHLRTRARLAELGAHVDDVGLRGGLRFGLPALFARDAGDKTEIILRRRELLDGVRGGEVGVLDRGDWRRVDLRNLNTDAVLAGFEFLELARLDLRLAHVPP